MSWREWLTGVVWILAAPTLVVGIFVALTIWANGRPQADSPLRAGVEPQVVWPWSEAELRLEVFDPGDAEPPPPLDMVFLVDISGSMMDSLEAMASAVEAVAEAMPRGPDATRFALVRFDSEAEIVTPWTYEPEELVRGLDRLLPPFTGQNDTGPAFARLHELLAGVRAGSQRVAIWYTDGALDACPSSTCPRTMTYDEIAEAAADLRRDGVGFFAVTPPRIHFIPHEVLRRITGPGRTLEPTSLAVLSESFRRVAVRALSGEENPARIEQRLDGRHFIPVSSSSGWYPSGDDAMALELVTFPGRATIRSLTLAPRSMGWWSVGKEPALLLRAGPGGIATEVNAARRPSVLVMSWWTLFLWGAPALLWALFHLPRKLEAEVELQTLPSIRRPSLPAALPPLPDPAAPPCQAVPTLFLGIGGQGREGLEAIRGELDHLHAGARGPHRFLAFDLDRRAPSPESAISAQETVELHLAPAGVTDVAAYLPDPGRVPDSWSWLDPDRYRDAAREELDLASGSRGDRVLGRLALCRWLAEEDLLATLRTAIRNLADSGDPNALRQVIVVASPEGGFGGGTFVDWGRLAKRLAREEQRGSGTAGIPDVIGLVVGDPRSEHRAALHLELESAQAAGRHPFATAYGDAAELSDVDGEPAFHAVFSLEGRDMEANRDRAAQLAVLLAEDAAHRATLEESFGIVSRGAGAEIVEVGIDSLRVPTALERERRRLDLLSRFLGPDVLLDFRIESGGEPRLPGVSEEEVDRRLEIWAEGESSDTPLGRLLAAATGGIEESAALEESGRTWPPEVEGWLRRALAASVSRQLRGAPVGGVWRRVWMPGEAAVVLRGLARRLAALPAPEGPARAALGALATAAEDAAAALDEWLGSAREGLLEVAAERQSFEKRQRRLGEADGIGNLSRPGEDAERETREIFGVWLGEQDTTSTLREHLYPAVDLGATSCTVVVCDTLQGEESHGSWQEAEERLRRLSEDLAASRQPMRLTDKLVGRSPSELRRLAETLVSRDRPADRVLLVRPAPVGEHRVDRSLAELVESIPQPADHGGRPREVASADRTAVRRLSLILRERDSHDAESPGQQLAAAPEVEAERVRRRLERRFRRSFPVLPVALRIALSRPAAFRRFATAYRDGRVIRRTDESGVEQWFAPDENRFLTFGSSAGLAEAAASHGSGSDLGPAVGAEESPGEATGATQGDFSVLDAWLYPPDPPSGSSGEEVVTLAAIRLFSS